MDNMTLVAIAVAALVVIAAVAIIAQRRRSRALKSRYGAEYASAVDETGNRRRAEAELRERDKRVRAFDLHTLSPRETLDFSDRWRQVQAQFVDEPGAAISHAEDLLSEVMQARGYPPSAFEQRAADLSVHHPKLVSAYREAHEVTHLHDGGRAGTEDLRRAFIHYRALFEDLLGEEPKDRPATIEPRSFTAEEAARDLDRDDVRLTAEERAERERRSIERRDRI